MGQHQFPSISDTLWKLEKIILICLAYQLVGCSFSKPHVTSLLSQFTSFQLTTTELRIHSLSELSHIAVSGRCDFSVSGMTYSLPDVAPNTWNAVPANSASGFFTTVQNNCSRSSGFQMELDLSSTAPFSTMTQGSTYKIAFRTVNPSNTLEDQRFNITFSNYNLADDQFNNGQGLNDTKTNSSTTDVLQGRITNIQKLPIISGTTHTLQGQVVFQ